MPIPKTWITSSDSDEPLTNARFMKIRQILIPCHIMPKSEPMSCRFFHFNSISTQKASWMHLHLHFKKWSA